MAEQKDLLRVIHRLVTDQDLRRHMLIAPRETLIAELGISRQSYDALVALVPVVLAGGLLLLGDGTSPSPDVTDPSRWGGWSKR